MTGIAIEDDEIKEIKKIIVSFTLEAEKLIPLAFQKQKKRVIVLSGPTACGKSDLAMELARQIDGEIISADSMQVYRGMDIGTAKPSSSDLLEVPHHLVNIRDVSESFNVVDFYYEARLACQQILDRGNVPIIAGGSGFYLHALLYGPPSGPPSVPELRKSLEEEMSRLGPESLYERLAGLDPIYAKSITKNDKQKVIRALEIISLTHGKVSQLSWKGRRKPQHFDFHCWFIHRPKDKLYQRINKRCEHMLEMGFLDEVKALEPLGIRNNSSACQAIGYRQALDFLSSAKTEQDYQHFVESFKQASRNYAKRQFTWFRKEQLFRWLDVDLHDKEVALDIIKKDFETL